MTETQSSDLRRAAYRRRARWGRFRRWGLGAAALGLPFAVLPADQAKSQALPTGGNVVGGAGTISQTSANQLTINQNSATLSIDWQSFSVGAGNIVRFIQPDSSSLALNRVIGPDPSMIFGSIQANGRVVIMNPAGIYFGPSAMVDVNGLVATTSRMNQADFLAGNLNFSIAGDVNARVINEGFVNVAQGGFAVLSAAAVENKGTIVAQGGTVVLAGTPTFTLDFFGDGLLKFASTGTVNQAPAGANALVENSGTVQANGGRVLMTARAARDVINNVINVTGIVEARSARIENGEIVIDGGENGIVSVNASLDVSGQTADAKGGTIKVLGEKVGLFENARLDASGDAGGGTVLVGGNYQGKGPEANAKMVYMDARAVIDASSALADGGRVILWSDEATRNAGHIDVSGAVNGGFIEVSSKGFLDFRGTVGLQGVNGAAGTLLLDPTDITISGSASSGDMSGSSPFSGSNASSNLYVATLNAALNGGTVIVSTNSAAGGTGYIDITTGITNSAANSTLVLQADGAITITGAGSINSGGYLLNVVFQAASNISIGGAISTSGGNITTTGYSGTGKAAGNLTTTANINTGGGLLNVNQTGSVDFGANVTVGGGTGVVTLNADGAVTQSAGAFNAGGDLVIGGTGAVTLAQAGNNFLNITLNRTGTSNSVTLYNNITGNIQTSTLGTGGFAYTSATAGFTQSGAITQDAGATGIVSINGGSGTVTLSQANSWSGDLSVGGANITVSGAQTFTNTVSKSANFVQTGAGVVSITGNILATSGSVAVVATSDTQVAIGAQITTLGGNIQLYADAPGGITGSGTGTGNRNGVSTLSGADLNAGGGNITIVGRGGNSSNNVGVSILDAQVRTSGTGYISIEGLGTSAGGGHSIVVENSSVTSTSATGSIAFMGPNPGGGNAGLSLKGASVTLGGASFQNNLILQVDSITNSATSLSLTRQAGGGTVTFLTLSGGDVILNGTGSGLGVTSDILSGISNFGTIQIGSASATGNVSVGAAYTAPNNTNLSLIGTGSGTATVGYALTTQGTGSLTVSGDAGVAINANLTTGGGDILIKGNVSSWTTPNTNTAPTFGSASGTFTGVAIASGVTVNAAGGNIAIAGKGGDSGINQYGVSMAASSVVSTTGAGTINIVGEGGASASNGGGTGGAHIGLYFNGNAAGTFADISSQNGSITLTGTGAGTAATSNNNDGMALLYAKARATGTGAVTLTGTASFGASRGVTLFGTTTEVSSAGGAVSVTGTGGGSEVVAAYGFVSRGIDIVDGASVSSTGAGNITLRGIAGSAGNGLVFRGTAATVGGASHTGNTTLRADDLVNSATTLTLSRQAGGGTIIFRTDTDATTIGVNGGAGTLAITSGILSAVSGFSIQEIGSASQTGAITTGGGWTLARNTDLISTTGGTISLGSTALGGNILTLNSAATATQSGTISGSGTLNFEGAGDVTLASGANSFSGTLTLAKSGTAANVTIWTSGAMNLGASTMGTGSLSWTSVGLTQSGAFVQDAGSAGAEFNANAGNIVLTNASNAFVGPLSLYNSGGGTAQLTNSIATNLGYSTIGAGLTVVSGGNITQSGQISAGGASSFTANGGSITLTNASNAFGGAVALTTTGANMDASVATGAGLTLGSVVITGDLTATAPGTLTLGSAITMASGKNVTVTASGAASALMYLNANLTLAGGTFTATSARSIYVGSVTINSGGGDITMSANATGANGGLDFAGLFVNGGTIESRGGNIDLTGKGSASGTTTYGQHGIFLNTGIVRSYTSAGDGTTGTITLTGAGGSYAGGNNGGVTILGAASVVSSRDGAITINATGGTGASGGNAGLYIGGGAIRTDGAGSITATAAGGDGNASRGIAVTGASGAYGLIETTGSGNITLTGTGGTTAGNNVGVYVFGSDYGVIRATGTGNVSVTGTGGIANSASNVGIAVQDTNSVISTNSGTLTLDGTATSSGTDPHGVYVALGGAVTSTSGAISITGDSTNGYGFATGGSNWTIGGGTTTGNISIVADTVNFTTTGASIQTTGNVTINPVTASTTIGIGGGTGTLQIVDDLSFVNAGNLLIGGSTAGAIEIGASGLSTNANSNLMLRGTSIALFGDVTLDTTKTLTFHANSAGVNQAGGNTITAQNLILRGAGDFLLNHGNSGYNVIEHVAANVTAGSGSGNIDLRTTFASSISRVDSETDTTGTVSGITTPGNLTWVASGGLTQAAGAAVNVGGATTLTAQSGSILFDNASGNMFTGPVSSTSGAGGAIHLTGDSLFLGTTVSDGDLILSATSGGITQSGLLTVSGNLNASAAGGSLGLSTHNNVVAGSVSLATSGGSNIAWGQSGPLSVGSISSSGTLNVSVTGGAITQVGAITTAGAADISADTGNITLTNASNAFGGPLTLYAASGSASVTTAGALSIAAIDVANSLAITAGGAITQSGAIQVGSGTTSLAATGTMTLSNSLNSFGSTLALTGVGGALDGTVNGNLGAAAAPAVTAVGNGFTFGGTSIANSATTSPGGNEGTTLTTVTTETLAQIITQILTSTTTTASSSTATTDAANVNPVSPAAVQAMLIAILTEAASPAGSTGGGQQGSGEGNNPQTAGSTPQTGGAQSSTPTPAAGAGTFAAGTTITINTSGGAVQSITVTPVGGGAPVTILPGLLNLTPPAIPTATATGTPGISGNFPLSWRQ
ncbi:MAG: hypothetical protein C6Y20_04270 [Tagaea sp. CACIAM 22H2]|nr:hypothetical protein [Tagaea sp. CACIAM 22H2]